MFRTPVAGVAIAFVATYYLSAIVQTLSHRIFGHTKRVMAIYANHTHGHHARYARNDLLQDAWVESERHVLWYFAVPFAAIAAAVWVAASPAIFIAHLAGLAFSFGLHLVLHRHYHIRGSVLERFEWFRRKRALHFVHHRRVRTNYAIVENWIDRVLGTYRAEMDPAPATLTKAVVRLGGALLLLATIAIAGCVTSPVYGSEWPEQVKLGKGECPSIDGEFENAGEVFYAEETGKPVAHLVSLAHILNGGYAEQSFVAEDRLGRTTYFSAFDGHLKVGLNLDGEVLHVTGYRADGSVASFELPVNRRCEDSVIHVDSKWGVFLVMNTRMGYGFGRALDGSLLVRTSSAGAGLAYMILPMAGSAASWIRFRPAPGVNAPSTVFMSPEEMRLAGH